MNFQETLIAGALAAAAGIAMTTTTALASTEWRGGGFVTDFVGCEEYGWYGIQQVISRIRPSGMPGNSSTHDRFMMQFASGQINIFIPEDSDLGYPYIEVDGASAWTAISIHDNPRMQLRITRGTTVVDMDENTPFIELYGNIENFDGLEGCNARFGIVAAKR